MHPHYTVEDVVITRGTTYANRANLAPGFFDSVVARFEGTRRGRQELEAAVIDDIDGALWTYSMIEAARLPKGASFDFRRIVVAVDPAATAGEDSDETGIVVAALGMDGRGYILADLSGRYSPQEWASRAINAYHVHRADKVVIETNMGGDMAHQTLLTVDRNIPVSRIHAKRGKVTRAEPIGACMSRGGFRMLACLRRSRIRCVPSRLAALAAPFAGCERAALLKNLQVPDMVARRNP